MRHDRIPLHVSSEYDALTRAHHYHHFRPGQRKKVKRQYNKRLRRSPWQEIAKEATNT